MYLQTTAWFQCDESSIIVFGESLRISIYPLTYFVDFYRFLKKKLKKICQAQFESAINAALRIIDGFQPDLDTSKAKQVDVLEEFGNVSNV